MIDVKVFGSEPPCSYCKRAEAAAREAAGRFSEGEVTVTKLAAGSPEGLAAGFTTTPAVAVNGRVVSEGRVPDVDEMERILSSLMDKKEEDDVPVLMEVFSGDPPCPGCVTILAMADRYASKYPAEELTVRKYVGREAIEKYEEYNLSCVPAVVVNGVIKIEGTAPDDGTMNNALREGGLWLR